MGAGGAQGGTGSGCARVHAVRALRAVRLRSTPRGSRACTVCGRVLALRSLGAAAFCELLEAREGYSILRSLARGGSGELGPSGDSSGLSLLEPRAEQP